MLDRYFKKCSSVNHQTGNDNNKNNEPMGIINRSNEGCSKLGVGTTSRELENMDRGCCLVKDEDSTSSSCTVCKLETFVEKDWKFLLEEEFRKDYFLKIKKALHSTSIFYPPIEKIFNFTHFSSFKDIKVVIMGQDPYHNPGQAMGLSFSVPRGIKIPPSLINIYQELSKDIPGFVAPGHGDLTEWAAQGVLLLNDTLTVEKNKPASHSEIGWKRFTKRILELINTRLQHVVFMLWGNHARQNARLIDGARHLILEAGHPSPFSVKMFEGCKHFSKANKYLSSHLRGAIDWKLSN
ncbi:uracil-DNA glycosylase [Vittaforma corneae ATCC 50505]|uniref:Uracil-DNA glycosylase n=1 Tax=Vittaforma corneae (strain ATCC 50505) TaxID=993615 RepID=L2GQC8_VITCO|nr:uracil-DNA glycosylase [Vittaforma corneae ATCC 50505]ELA42700.1 uracil-DNA glycosylase [Vittaforma corneae ATCC 50505]